ncbi:MAG TPA: ABC transporter ATP-binding protein, partial [Woeseiaceae bacterium]|nr:ABC transporter ATP-binding protein [Woeseiaceae bacterium]
AGIERRRVSSPPMTEETTQNTPPVLAAGGLRFAWQAGQTLLDIPVLDIAPGEKVLIRGASGSGKSTLLNLFAGILTPTAGTVSLLGTDLSALPGATRDRFRAEHLGIIFQLFNLLPWLPVLDNVLLPCRFSRRRLLRARESDGSEETAARRLLAELGLPEAGSASAARLSIGQQQRVAAARALIGNPEIVIADEPTSALDEDSRAAFLALLQAECERVDATLIMVSHERSLEPLFDRVIPMRQLAAGTS